MENQNSIYDNLMIGKMKWAASFKSLIIAILLVCGVSFYVYFSNQNDSNEPDKVTIIAIAVIVVFILFLPNIILFYQYYSNNRDLNFKIDFTNSILEISRGENIDKIGFEDIVVSKIYKTNYKLWSYNLYELFYRNFGYWYICTNTNKEYRITSLLTNLDTIPTITDTDIEFVAFPNFKKEELDIIREYRVKVNFWKYRFRNLKETDLIRKWENRDVLDHHAEQAVKEMIEKVTNNA